MATVENNVKGFCPQEMKVFVASSEELDNDRNQVVSTLHSIDKYHKYLRVEPVTWKTDLEGGSYDKPSIQDEINPLLKECRVVIVLFFSKVGKFTLEEYKLAVKEKKKVFIYFKKGFSPGNSREYTEFGKIIDLKNYLDEENTTIFYEFNGLPQLSNRVQQDVNLFISRECSLPLRDKLTAFDEYRSKVHKFNVNQEISTSGILFGQSLEGLEEQQLIRFLEQERVIEHFAGKEPEDIEEKLNHLALMRGNDLVKGTFLCLGKRIAPVSKSAVESRFYVFATKDKTKPVITEVVNGNLITQYTKMLQHLKRNLYLVRDVFSDEPEDYEIPQIIFKELLANAFLHREYADKKEYVTTIQVELYVDRLEIKNPGTFPDEIRFEVLKETLVSYLRNPEIAQIFFLYKFVEKAGSGILRIVDKLAEKKFKPATFENIKDRNLVKVTVYKKKRFEEEHLRGEPRNGLKSLGGAVSGTRLLTPMPSQAMPLVGRESQLKQMARFLQEKHSVLLVNGLGGIGKTELCRRFFLDHYQDYAYAGWVEFTSSVRVSLVQAFYPAFIPDALEEGGEAAIDEGSGQQRNGKTLDQQFDQIVNFLAGLGGDWLLVLDNVEEPGNKDLDLLRSLPGTLLVNSRLRLAGFPIVELEALSLSACRKLFYHYYKGRRDDNAVNDLIDLSGKHTLTIELLARTAHNAGLTAPDLLERLNATGFDLAPVVPEKVRTGWGSEREQKTLFLHLQKVFQISGLADDEENLLMHLSVLPSKYMSRGLVKELLSLSSLDALTSLVEKGWLLESEDGVLMHQVVREVLRSLTLPDAEKCRPLIQALAGAMLLEPADNPLDRALWAGFAGELLSHILDLDEELANLANNTSSIYQALGQMEDALEFQTRATQIYEAILDKNHPSIATSYNNSASIYQRLGHLEKALEFQLKAVKIRETILDGLDPDLSASYGNLSIIYEDLGQLEKALEFQLKDVRILEQILGTEHPSLAVSYNNLCTIYFSLGQMNKALEYQEKSIDIVKLALPENHPDLASSYNNLSQVYKAVGELEKALEYQEKSIHIKEKVLPENHPDLAGSYHNISAIYLSLSQPGAALENSRKAVAILRHHFPNGHPNLEVMERNLAFIEKEVAK